MSTEARMDRIIEAILGRMKNQSISQDRMAWKLGMTQQNFSSRCKRKSFTVKQLLIMLDVLGFNPEETAQLLTN